MKSQKGRKDNWCASGDHGTEDINSEKQKQAQE